MTLKEVKKLISESPNHELFSNHLINFNFHRSEIQRNFDGILSFYEYLLNQQNGYDKVDFELPQEFQDSKSLFKKLIDKVSTFIETYQNINQSSFLSVWEQHVNSVISGHRNLSIFEIDAPNTNFLLEIYKNKQSNYLGALHYLTLAINSSSLSDRNYLNGVILAYEYFQKGETEIEKRRIKEKSSLSKFRNHIYEYISQAEKNFIEYSASLKNKSENTIKEVESYKNSKTEEYEKWYQDTSSAFSLFDKESKNKIDDLEKLYREKLKLEAPAQYWNKRATSLKTEGRWWLTGTIVSILLGVVIFIIALQLLADGVLAEIFEETTAAIKWSVIFITLVSFLAFLIKTLSKLTFSTFHLSRDAEEREQLTYVFLAMQKEKAIDPTERHLIMQSLFSRADTGLLKDEGSPTMPGNIFDKIVANGK